MLGRELALERARLAARLTGLQQYRRMAASVGGVDGGPRDAAHFLSAMFAGMDDDRTVEPAADGRGATLLQRGLRIARGLEGDGRADLLAGWAEVWRGAVHSQREFIDVAVDADGAGLRWTLAAPG